MEAILNKKDVHDSVDLRLSIHQNIELILHSFTLSYRFDPAFGSLINKYYASTPPQGRSERHWREAIREKIQANLREMLTKYETRVQIKTVNTELSKARRRDKTITMSVRIHLSGRLTIGRREQFHYPDSEVLEEAKEVFPLMIPVGKYD